MTSSPEPQTRAVDSLDILLIIIDSLVIILKIYSLVYIFFDSQELAERSSRRADRVVTERIICFVTLAALMGRRRWVRKTPKVLRRRRNASCGKTYRIPRYWADGRKSERCHGSWPFTLVKQHDTTDDRRPW